MPSANPDAAKLRLHLSTQSGLIHLGAFIRPIASDKTCGEPVRLPMMFAHFDPPPQTREPLSHAAPLTYPRADMIGSPEPTQSDVVEVRLEPGLYSLRFIGSHGTIFCEVSAEVELLARSQHQITVAFDRRMIECNAVGAHIESDGSRKIVNLQPKPPICKP